MFSKLALVAVTAFAALAVANPTPGGGEGSGQCATKEQYCCNSVQDASTPQATKIIGSLVGVVAGITGNVGLTCSQVTVIGASGNSCKQQPVCCNGNNYQGLVVVGCSPINIG